MVTEFLIHQFKSSLVKMAVDELMKQLITSSPLFANPVINPITTHVLRWIAKRIVDLLDTEGYLIYITFKSNEEAKRFAEAARKNEEVQKNGTPEQIAAAEKATIDAAREMIKFGKQ